MLRGLGQLHGRRHVLHPGHRGVHLRLQAVVVGDGRGDAVGAGLHPPVGTGTAAGPLICTGSTVQLGNATERTVPSGSRASTSMFAVRPIVNSVPCDTLEYAHVAASGRLQVPQLRQVDVGTAVFAERWICDRHDIAPVSPQGGKINFPEEIDARVQLARGLRAKVRAVASFGQLPR